jgi:hypothetical protein
MWVRAFLVFSWAFAGLVCAADLLQAAFGHGLGLRQQCTLAIAGICLAVAALGYELGWRRR